MVVALSSQPRDKMSHPESRYVGRLRKSSIFHVEFARKKEDHVAHPLLLIEGTRELV